MNESGPTEVIAASIPGTLFPGLFSAGAWLTTADGAISGYLSLGVHDTGFGLEVYVAYPARPGAMPMGLSPAALRLDLRQPTSQWLLHRVMTSQRSCWACGGKGYATFESYKSCLICSCADWPLFSAPCRHLIPEASGGALPDALSVHSGALLARHAERIAEGAQVGILDVLRAWPEYKSDSRLNKERSGHNGGSLWAIHGGRLGRDTFSLRRHGYVLSTKGFDSFAEAQRMGEEVALERGFALLDRDGSLRLPLPVKSDRLIEEGG